MMDHVPLEQEKQEKGVFSHSNVDDLSQEKSDVSCLVL